MPFAISNLAALLQKRVQESPEKSAYIFLSGEDFQQSTLTYSQMDVQARAIAGLLQSVAEPGERALLLYPPGLDFIAAFFGCLYAGIIAVPAYPPRLNRNALRITAIAEDSEAKLALSTSAVVGRLKSLAAHTPGLGKMQWFAADQLARGLAESWREVPIKTDGLAYLQYTSGSTATPKGVMISHANVLHNSDYLAKAFRHSQEDRSLSWLPHFHDLGLVHGILQPLYSGFPGYLMPPMSFLQRPLDWLRAISQFHITHTDGPNFAYELCAMKVPEEEKTGLDLSRWIMALNGAEPVFPETMECFAAAFAGCGFKRSAFYPAYGLAEATLVVSGAKDETQAGRCCVLADALERNKIVFAQKDQPGARVLSASGMFGPGMDVEIVDPESSCRCADHEIGEIWVSGQSVALGYWKRAEETEQTFRAKLGSSGEQRFLRTGDLGFVHDEHLYITGRLKELIIIRGRNYYPQDIERTARESCPAIQLGTGAAFSISVATEERLVLVQEISRHARVVAEGIFASIRTAIAEEYEVQVHEIVLVKSGAVPKTSSGKIQRRLCREKFLQGNLEIVSRWRAPTVPSHADDGELPRTAEHIEKWFVRKIAAALGIQQDRVDADRPLSRFGIDSIRAIELALSVETKLGIGWSAAAFLEDKTIAELAKDAVGIIATGQGSNKSLPAAAQREMEYPLSYGQSGLWFLHQLAPGSAAYNVVQAIKIRSGVDISALKTAFQALVSRHGSLRTTFAMANGKPFQRVHENAEVAFVQENARDWNDEQLQERLAAEASHSFDLEHGPVFRVHVFIRSQNEHVLLITAHHIIIDLWSLAQMMHELGVLYAAEISGQPLKFLPPVREYSEFVSWQKATLGGEQGEEMWAYWSQQLAGELPVLNLPGDRPRPPVQTYTGACYSFRFGAELSAKLKKLGQNHGATLYVVLLAAFDVLLHKYTAEEDIIVGTPFAGRAEAEFASTVGYFVNTVPLRVSVSAASAFDILLEELRATTLEALRRQGYPFSLLVDRLDVTRDPSRSSLFQVMFAMQKSHLLHEEKLPLFALGEPGARMNLGGLEVESMSLPQRIAQFDLSLMVAEAGDDLAASFEYNTDLFESETIRRMAGHFLNLLERIVADPTQPISSLSLLTQDERRQIVGGFNPPPREFSGCTLHELFEEQAARKPEASALIYKEQQMSYKELNQRANQLAHYLHGVGVRRGSRVGLCIERSIETIICMLGILKAGATYVPLDPRYPKSRLHFLIQDADIQVLLTQTALFQPLPENRARLISIESEARTILSQKTENPRSGASADDVAYVIYTSGSTGRPKGVAVNHGAANNHMQWIMREFPLEENGRMLHKHSTSFDASLSEILHPLLSGATLVIAPPGAEYDPGALIQIMRKQQVTAIDVVPAMLKALIENDEITNCTDLRLIISGGEALAAELQQDIHERLNWVQVVNAYGPTETAITAAFHKCNPQDKGPVPIGKPISNTQIYILDQALQPVPVGVVGEIHIGGHGLGHGYLNEPSISAERFIPDPFGGKPGARLYKTGDLGRYRQDGNIEYLRRADRQVKIRGFRIEFGEIEAELKKHKAVDDAVVIARSRAGGSNQILAYVTSRQKITPALLRSHLKRTLPEYMLPAGIMVLERFPLLSNGKLNLRALPEPEEIQGEAGFAPPQNKVERELARIWEEVLRRKDIGMNDNFFALGGDSILAIQVVARARNAGLEITPAQVVRFQTIASLSAVAKRWIARLAPQVLHEGSAPLTPIQRWFFEQELPEPQHYNQAIMLEVKRPLKIDMLEKAFQVLRANHAALRTCFQRTEQGWRQTGSALVDHQVLRRVSLSGLKENHTREIQTAASEAQSRLNLRAGDLMRAVYFDAGEGGPHRLLIVIHHLVVDGVSWRILLENLQTSYEQLERGEEVRLTREMISFGQWSDLLSRHAQTETILQERSYWTTQAFKTIKPLPRDFDGENTAASSEVFSIALDPEATEALLQRTAHAYHTQINDVLLAALGQALADWAETKTVLIDLEGHGREEIVSGADLSNTVGWFTTMFPVVLELESYSAPGELLRSVKAQLRQIPRKGIGYGLLRYLSAEPMQQFPQAEISFNYLGQWDQICAGSSVLTLSDDPVGPLRSSQGRRSHLIEIDAYINDRRLQVQWTYSRNVHSERSMAQVAGSFIHQLSCLVEHCASRTTSEHTPSDFPLIKLTERQLERLQKAYGQIADIYPLSPIQQGMLFHSLFEPRNGTYLTQFICELTGNLNKEAFCAAWQNVVNSHSSLKACFEAEIVSDEPVQVIANSVDLNFHYDDWSDATGAEREHKLRDFLEQDHERGINLKTAPLMRFALFQAEPSRHIFIWSSHHLLMDGWSLPIILKDVFAAYDQLRQGRQAQIRPARPYKDYIGWLKAQDRSDAEAFWRHLLAGFASPVSLRVLQSTAITRSAEEFTEREIRLSRTVTELLQGVVREHQLTLSALAYAAWALLLRSYTGANDVVFGMVVSGRPAEIADVESMVGVFINTLPVRLHISDEADLISWVKELQMQQAEIGQYGHIPLAQVQAWSELPRRTRLFESILVFENYPDIDVARWLGGSPEQIQISNIRSLERSNYPITVWVMPGREISLKIGYDASQFDSVRITGLLDDYRALLEAMAASPLSKVAEVLKAIIRATQTTSGRDGADELQDAPAFSASTE